MASKAPKIESFGPQDKSTIKGRVQHSRTGACTAKGRCNHGMIKRRFSGAKGKKAKRGVLG